MSDYKQIIEKIEPELKKAINFLEEEMLKIRTSFLSPSLVEDIEVEIEGNQLSVKELAAISLISSREMSIQPWDKSYLQPIQKAIEKSSLGIAPVISKDSIRLSAPSISQEYRKKLLQVVADKKEDTRKTLRHFREEAWKKIQEESKKGGISEDDKFRAKDKLQKLVDEYNEKISGITERKSKEIEG
jgi:ribosome recycling factor